MTASLPQQLGLQRKSISIPIQRKDLVPPHLMSIREMSDPMDTPALSSSYCAGFRPVRLICSNPCHVEPLRAEEVVYFHGYHGQPFACKADACSGLCQIIASYKA